MRIFLHIGPRKTGTTSLQAYLLARFGSPEPQPPIWYPTPVDRGPGHARLARLMNDPDRDPASNALADVVEDAHRAGVETLILSSENFEFAYLGKLGGYAAAVAGHDLVLVTTQNPLASRVTSIWQEMVKHGSPATIAESTSEILNRPGLRPDFLNTFAGALEPSSVVIIHSDRAEPPHLLIDRAMTALGVPTEGTDIRRNVSLGHLEADLLRHMNVVLEAHSPGLTKDKERYWALRDVLLAAFRAPDWTRHRPDVPIQPPDELKDAAQARAREIAAEIEALKRDWPVEVFGEPA